MRQIPISPIDLPHIYPISTPYLPCISSISPLYLPRTSPNQVSEFPNIRRAHRTLAALNPSLHLALFYDPLHVQTAAEYAADRADERGC